MPAYWASRSGSKVTAYTVFCTYHKTCGILYMWVLRVLSDKTSQYIGQHYWSVCAGLGFKFRPVDWLLRSKTQVVYFSPSRKICFHAPKERFPTSSFPRTPYKNNRSNIWQIKRKYLFYELMNNEIKYIVLKRMFRQKRPNYLSSYVNYKDKNTPLLIFFREPLEDFANPQWFHEP
jgi:hypothetical protein